MKKNEKGIAHEFHNVKHWRLRAQNKRNPKPNNVCFIQAGKTYIAVKKKKK